MGFEQLQNILDWNKEEQARHQEDEDLENNMCPYDAWPLKIDSAGNRACEICGRTWR